MPRAALFLDPSSAVGPVNPRIFGSFVEHLGRCVYTGIWEPDHPTADKDGFRQDVIELVKELGVTAIRYREVTSSRASSGRIRSAPKPIVPDDLT